MLRIARLDLSRRRPLGDLTAIRHANRARLTVQFEEHGARTVLVRIAGGDVPDDQRLAALQVDVDFLARVHAVEEHGGRQRAHVAERGALGGVFRKHLGIHEMRGEFELGDRPADFGLRRSAFRLQIRGRQEFSRAHGERLPARPALFLCSA